MMGRLPEEQAEFFYEFCLASYIPEDHLLRGVDRFLDFDSLRQHLRSYYSELGRPSVDPELMMRMLILGYCCGIRSERQLCEEVHFNIVYRWFCRLGLEGKVPDHSMFSKNRHGRFRDSEAFRYLFEDVLRRCMEGGLVRGEGFAVDASVIRADAQRQQGVDKDSAIDWGDPEEATRSVREYLVALEDASDTRIRPSKNISFYGSAAMLGWLVEQKQIAPHIPVWDTSEGKAGQFGRSDFIWDPQADRYLCPAGHSLERSRLRFKKNRSGITKANTIIYRASKFSCDPCPLKLQCCPKEPARKIHRSVHEAARDVARSIYNTEAYKQSGKDRKKVEILFAHLKRILKLDRLRLRGHTGAKDEFLLAATTQNLRRMVKLLSVPPPGHRINASA